jgi:hypothetical protein
MTSIPKPLTSGVRVHATGLAMAVHDRRKAARVPFERGIATQIMAIEGTWHRACTMEDVSQTGACLMVEGSVAGLAMKEFFLLPSSTGLAYRRCELKWVNGDHIGVEFLVARVGRRMSSRSGRTAAAEEMETT